MSQRNAIKSEQGDTVVLVHGLAGSRLDMLPLAIRLRKSGFNVINWGYWSLNTSIRTHAARLVRLLESLENSDEIQKVHLVGHSMGGIIIRTALADHRLAATESKIDRAIQLAPPNRGSHVATLLSPLLGWLAPSLNELSDTPDSFVNSLPNSLNDQQLHFGVVEASKDRVIRADCVQLEGQKDFARVEGHHGILTWYPQTSRLVENFLCTGKFTSLDEVSEDCSLTRNANQNAVSV